MASCPCGEQPAEVLRPLGAGQRPVVISNDWLGRENSFFASPHAQQLIPVSDSVGFTIGIDFCYDTEIGGGDDGQFIFIANGNVDGFTI